MVRPLPQMTGTHADRRRATRSSPQKPDAYSIILALSTRRLAHPYAGYAASLVIPFVGGLPCRGQKSARWYAEKAGDNRPAFLMAIATKLLASLEEPARVDLFLPGKAFGDSFAAEPGSQQISKALRLAYEAELRRIDLFMDTLDSKATPRLAQVQRLLDQTPENKVFDDDAFQLCKIDLEAYEEILTPNGVAEEKAS